MGIDLIHVLSVGVGAAALSVAVLHAVRDSMIRAERRRMQQRAGDSSRSAGARSGGSGAAGGVRADEPADGARDAGADRSPQAGTRDVRTPAGGDSYDPRPQEDAASRRLAYHLVAILAVVIFSLLAMVAFGVISVDDVEKFGVIVAPIVTLVTAATSFYFGNRRSGK